MSGPRPFTLPAVLLTAFTSAALAAPSPPATSPADDEADHAALRALIPVYEQAAAAGQPDLLKPHLDAAFTGVMLTGDALDSPAALDAYYAKLKSLLGPDGKYTVKVHVAEKSLLAGDLAYARGTTDDAVDARGNHYAFHSDWTAVCRKTDGAWKLLRIQATIDPIGNPFVHATVRRAVLIAGVVAGAVGLAVGLAGAALLARRRRPGTPRP